MAKFYLDNNDVNQRISNKNTSVYGANATESVIIDSGVTGTIVDQNVESATFAAGSTLDYKYSQSGNKLKVYAADGTTLVADVALNSAGTPLTFSNGTVTAEYSTTGVINLGGKAVTSTATVIDIAATVDATKTSGGKGGTTTPVTGSTFTLTTGLDNGTAFTGGAGNDTFSGPLDSWSVLDELNGGLGNDTLAVATTATTAPVASQITGIEKIVITTTGAGYTLNTTSYTGLTDLTVSDATQGTVAITGATTTKVLVTATGGGTVALAGFGGDVTVVAGTGTTTTGTAANALTSYSLTGGAAATINDKSGSAAATGSTLKTVTLTSVTDDAGITANGITSLNVNTVTNNGGVGDVTITAAAATRALTLNLNGVVAANAATMTYTDATATTLSVNSNTAASKYVTVVAGAATTVNVSAAVALQLDALTTGVATAVNLSGSAALTITADTLASTAVITSTNTGGVTLTQALTASQQFVGSSSTGADSISIATSYAKAVTTGAGNDTVIIAGAFATGGSVDAGDGDADVLSLTGALAANDSLSASSTFAGLISGFEILSLDTVVSQTVDLSKLDNLSYVKTTGATALVLDKLASNGTVEITASSTQVTAQITDANVGGHSSDIVNLKLNAATSGATVNYDTFVAANVETINIQSTRSGTIVAADTNDLDLTVANAVTINVTGAVQADISGVALTGAALSTINASTNTGGLKVTTTGATQGILISGSATAANTVVGGSGGDVINGGSAADDLNGGAGADLIVGGAGTDTITGGTGLDTLTGGAGVDKFVLDTLAVNADTITDFVKGTDIVDLSAALTLVTLTIGTQVAHTGVSATDIAAITTAANTDAEVYYIANSTSSALTLAQIETAITAGSAATGQATILIDNGTDTLIYFDAAAQTDAGAGAGLILVGTLSGITGATALATGDLISV